MSRQDLVSYFLTKNGVSLAETDRNTPWNTLSQQPIEKIEAVLHELLLHELLLDLYPTTEELIEGNRENCMSLFLLMFTLSLAAKKNKPQRVAETVSVILKIIEECTTEKQIDLLMRGLVEKATDGITAFWLLVKALSCSWWEPLDIDFTRSIRIIVFVILKCIEKCTTEKQLDLLMQGLAEKATDGRTGFWLLMDALSLIAKRDSDAIMYALLKCIEKCTTEKQLDFLMQGLAEKATDGRTGFWLLMRAFASTRQEGWNIAEIILKLIEKCGTEKHFDLLMQALAEKATNGETGFWLLMDALALALMAKRNPDSIDKITHVILKLVEKCKTEKQFDLLSQGVVAGRVTGFELLIRAFSLAKKNNNSVNVTKIALVIFNLLKNVKKNVVQLDLISLKDKLRNSLKAYLNSINDINELKAIAERESLLREMIDCRADGKTNLPSATRILLNERITALEKPLLPTESKALLTSFLGIFRHKKQTIASANVGEELRNVDSVIPLQSVC